MASKSKRRGRVFRASCILAALIIAGSSFAWFTSKDEVTNRLTASSDYGVSIVESFAPPKNWLPGEDVNKDVYAVNTGNIDAFVKENIQGVLNYTYEDVVVDFGTADTKYVELTLDQVKAIQGQTTEDGFKTYEAGGYLAWTNAVNSTTTTTPASYSVGDTAVDLAQTGFEKVAYPEDNPTSEPMKTFTVKIIDPVSGTTLFAESDSGPLYTLVDGHGDYMVYTDAGKTLVKTDATSSTTTTPVEVGSIYEGRTQDITNPWTPTETGVYVFRRSINPQTATSQGKDIGNPFTYSGYYFVKGEGDNPDKYYKIVLGGDSYPAADRQEVTVDGKTRVDFVYDIFADSTDIVTNPLDDTQIDQETGEIKTDVGYMFVVEKEVKDQDVTFTMDDPNHRLVAEYTIAYAGDGTYDAKATLARAQVDYENAKGAYDAAKASYDNAVANETYGKALADAEQKLWKAKDALDKAYAAANSTDASNPGAKQQWLDAQKAVLDGAKYVDTKDGDKPTGITKDNGVRAANPDSTTDVLDDLEDGIASLKPDATGIMSTEVMAAVNGTDDPMNPYVAALHAEGSDFMNAYNNYKTIYEAIYGINGSGTNCLYSDIQTQLQTIKNNTAETDIGGAPDYAGKAATVKTASETLVTKAGELKTKMDALKKAYTNLVDALGKDTGIDTTGDAAKVGRLTTMNTVADDFNTNANDLDDLVDTLVTEEQEYRDAKEDLDGKTGAWKDAVDKYQEEVNAAKDAYNGATDSAKKKIEDANAWDANNFRHQFEDLSTTIVPAYSAITTESGDAPAFTAGAMLNGVKNYTGAPDYTWPTGVSVRNLDSDDEGTEPDLVDANFATKGFIGLADATARNAATSKTVSEWETAINGADGYASKLATAKHNYDVATAQNNNGSTLKFYVNLDPDYKDYWQFDTNTDNTANPTFYYRYVLEAGETSHKLIDSVEFDKDVSAGAYKDMTFDLNVGLDSAQVTYDDNQRLYETDAVDGNNAFVLKVTNPTTAFDADTQLTWGTPATT